MRLVDILHQHPPFDAPSGMVEALLATGKVEVYKEPIFNGKKATSKESHVTQFQIRDGAIVDDYQHPPFIWYSCCLCGSGQITGPTGKTMVFHQPPFGHVSYVPLEMQKEFIAARKCWERRNR